MTIYFTNNMLNSCSLSLNDNISATMTSGSTYIFSLKSDTSLKTYTVEAVDISAYPERFSKFQFYISGSGSANVLSVSESGAYTYNVYLSGSSSGSLEEGRAYINMNSTSEFGTQYTASNSYNYYRGQ